MRKLEAREYLRGRIEKRGTSGMSVGNRLWAAADEGKSTLPVERRWFSVGAGSMMSVMNGRGTTGVGGRAPGAGGSGEKRFTPVPGFRWGM